MAERYSQNQSKQKTILICPLDWGLGHATRIVPVINEFLAMDCRIIVAASGRTRALLEKEFETRTIFCEFPGKKITFSTGGRFFLGLVYELPSFFFSVINEHIYLKRLIRDYKPDIIISDNRYGVWHRSAISVIITHQLFIRLPGPVSWLTGWVRRLNHFLISMFDYCWVPDVEHMPCLSGELSHKPFFGNRVFIGPLSRLQKHRNTIRATVPVTLPDLFILIILSGPEPQRTTFEKQITEILESSPAVIFRGLPQGDRIMQQGLHVIFDNPPAEVMAYCISKCELVISRSGYSTIMDLSVFGSRAVFIPTPGQPEQEYLALLHNQRGNTISLPQNRLHLLPEAIARSKVLGGMPVLHNINLLKGLVREVLGLVKI